MEGRIKLFSSPAENEEKIAVKGMEDKSQEEDLSHVALQKKFWMIELEAESSQQKKN